LLIKKGENKMTMIVPAGNNKLDWSPKETKLQKTASEGGEAQDIEVDALYEAAKGVVEAEAEADIKEEKTEEKQEKEACGTMTDDEAIVLDVEEVPEAVEGEGEDIVEEVAEDGVVTEQEEEAVEDAAVDKIKNAVEEIEEAVEEVSQAQDAIEKVKEAVGEVEEVHDEVEGTEEEVEVEIIDDDEEEEVPGEEVVDDEVIVEGDKESCEEEASMDKSASAEEFCKYAKLSPQNRKKLNRYWTDMLGFPKDYVNLMTKDYEK
jgi:hypothetical protein